MASYSDSLLVQIVDAALLDAARKSGDWLVCKPGCTQCCYGVFAINQLDAARLREGLQRLTRENAQRAARMLDRVAESVDRLRQDFPGDPTTGLLSEDADAQQRFESFANEEPCPVLDPVTGTCDLYSSRPMTCRVFGPPVRSEHGLGVCELCYHGATPEEIAACEMVPDPGDLESILLEQYQRKTGAYGQTIVAFAFDISPDITPEVRNRQ
jgi:Fe-S-cluster containining protein